MKTDYCYCSGVCCPIKKQCKRYLPDPPDAYLWWVAPEYNEETQKCQNFDSTNNLKSNNNE